MDFGRVEHFAALDLSLPDDHADNRAMLGGSRRAAPEIFIGAPVWSHKGYVGKIYPVGTKQKDYLHHYSRQFNTIELNSTFYGVQPTSIGKWKASVPADFRFCPKLPSLISHDLALVGARGATESFVDTMQGLGEQLGPAWMNFPPRFGPEHLAALVDWLADWPTSLRLAIELRHPDWFSNELCLDQLAETLRELDIGLVITDTPGRRDVLHQRLTTPWTLIRFAGNLLHESDFRRLDAWIERLSEWIDQGLESVYLMLHQPDESLTIELAEHAAEALARKTGLEIRSPKRVERLIQRDLF